MVRRFRARQALSRRPRTRRGGRTFHASCVGAPSGDPLAAAADGDSTDPIRASRAPTKTKNLANDFAARTATVAALRRGQAPRVASCRLLEAGHDVLDDGVVLQRVHAQ